jgi:hypothetical protein
MPARDLINHSRWPIQTALPVVASTGRELSDRSPQWCHHNSWIASLLNRCAHKLERAWPRRGVSRPRPFLALNTPRLVLT